MGDKNRFTVFATFIHRQWPDKDLRIADVAGGKCLLNSELRRLGYKNVVTFDKRKLGGKIAKGLLRYGHFTQDQTAAFDLLVGMHPDGATDVIIAAAAHYHLPFAVVPCCIKPHAWKFSGERNYVAWFMHLYHRSQALGLDPRIKQLKITGASQCLWSRGQGRGRSKRHGR